MKQNALCLVLTTAVLMIVTTLNAEPTTKASDKRTLTRTQKSEGQNTVSTTLAVSANGWTYVKGEWVHPMGYKFVKGKVIRTTAKRGMAVPIAPGKLALDNPKKLTPGSNSAMTQSAADNARAAAEKAAETRRKNMIPSYAPSVGSHL